MRIAIVGDPHISTGFRARIDDYLQTVLNKINYIAENNDAIIFLGDVFDTSAMPTYVFNATYKALSKYSHKFHTILGNHDMFHRNVKSLHRTTIGSLDLTGIIKVHTKPFELGGVTFVPVMTDDEFESIPCDDDNDSVLLCHKYYEMMVCPEESFDDSELKDLNYKYVFMGHDHMPYEPLDLGNTILYRPGSLTRTTVDKYNEKRDIRYYVLETGTMEVYADIVPSLPSSEVYLNGSFAEKEVARHKAYNDRANIGKLLARFDRQLTSNISLEDVLRKGKVSEDIIMYLRDLHRLHNIKYN